MLKAEKKNMIRCPYCNHKLVVLFDERNEYECESIDANGFTIEHGASTCISSEFIYITCRNCNSTWDSTKTLATDVKKKE